MLVTMSRLVAVFVAAFIAAEFFAVGSANLIKVGGPTGWIPNTNYTAWSNTTKFYVGDWLYFVFDKYQYDVLEVNKTVYETCDSQAGFVANITRGGRDVFQLTEPRDYYFLCSHGFCWGGMKVAVTVQEPPPAPPTNAPPAKDAAAAVPTGHPGIVLIMLAMLVSSYETVIHGYV